MSLLLIMLGAGLVFSLTSRYGATLGQTQSVSFFLPPATVTLANAMPCASSLAPKAVVFAGRAGRVETVGLP